MYTISEAAEKLTRFTEQKILCKVVANLEKLNTFDRPQEDTIIQIRTDLRTFLSHQMGKKNSKNTARVDAVYYTLLALAELSPLNEQDPITTDAILDEERVYTSTGHQFSVYQLIHFHNTRLTRVSELTKHKWLLNPLTNLKFDYLDVAHIREIAMQKGISINNLNSDALRPGLALKSELKYNKNHFFSCRNKIASALSTIPSSFALVPRGISFF